MSYTNNLNTARLFVFSCTRSLAMRPQSIYLTCTHTLPHAIPTRGTISLVCLGQGQTYSKQVYPSLGFSMEQPTSDTQILSIIHLLQAKISCTPSGSYIGWINNCDSQNTARESERHTAYMTVRFLSDWHCNDCMVIRDLLYTPIEFRPVPFRLFVRVTLFSFAFSPSPLLFVVR